MAEVLSACNGVSYLIFSGVAVLLIERMGRHRMLPDYYSAGSTSDNGSVYDNASVAFFFLYFGVFGTGMLGAKGAAAKTATGCPGGILYFDLETGTSKHSPSSFIVASRSEALDASDRTNPSLIVSGDPEAICQERPQKYSEREDEEFKRVTGRAIPIDAA
ncbi:uncharacterized protein N7500_010541 [Penicillium coprophilum]|uniref:uncharacterized protein n=1 Tax=Penicillium coprophilum TaxID=36646 RepID=UPI002392A77D|nr:uncharacterized protein N7500_010541 [Penicillium coprophilum]KAJ5155102.1 hypothetical protein N7500_010541 [Penicillium coprophilum]